MLVKHYGAAILLTGLVVGGCIVGATLAESDKPSGQATAKQREATKAVAPEKEPLTDLQKMMRRKLGSSNKILEGLAVEDYKLIQAGAAELSKLSKTEAWRVSNDVMYRQHSREFQIKALQLGRMAKESKLEGAALSYVQVTLSCIECHKWVRAELMANGAGQPGLSSVR